VGGGRRRASRVDEEARDERDERHQQLAPRVPQRGPHGAGLATTTRDSRRLRLPANAGTSTVGGSAKLTSIPKWPRRVSMNATQPSDLPSWSSMSVGPIALI